MRLSLFLFLSCLAIACSQKSNPKATAPAKDLLSLNRKSVTQYTTADSTSYRLSETAKLTFHPFGQPFENQACVFLDPTHQFQTMLGIGGAITDASAETFAKLPAQKQQELLQAYFSTDKGIGYTIGRTNMNSCDFSSDMYTYVSEGDASLSSFSVAHDEKFKMPMIRKAMETTKGNMKLFISPWSPPAWMKDNDNMLQGGQRKPEYAAVCANYYVKFIQAYEQKGIPVWGLSVQNEPMAKQTWESCIYTAQEETDFIKNHLGPTLHRNKMSNKKLIAWDHNRDLLYQRASALLNDREAAKYVWGIGFHWYEIWNGGRQYENVKRVAEAYPGVPLMLTEACNYPFSWKTFDGWSWGEQYGQNMIHDFNNGAVAWTDWNILLDETGGPNHVNNFCFAPVHAKTKEGSLHYMNSYYYIGHFSKFIRPGAVRISCSSNRAQLLTTAFANPDGSIALVVMNETSEKIPYRLYLGDQAVETISLPHSIVTLKL